MDRPSEFPHFGRIRRTLADFDAEFSAVADGPVPEPSGAALD